MPLLEMLYAVVDSEQNKKTPLFFLASYAPKNWAIALEVTLRGPKYAQKGSDQPKASAMCPSLLRKPSYYTSASKLFNFEQPSLYFACFLKTLPDQPK